MSKEKQIEEIFNIIINRMLRVKRGGYIPMSVFVEITQDILGAGYRKQSGWISVEERLPEDTIPADYKCKTIKVLVAIKEKNGIVIRTQKRFLDYVYEDDERTAFWTWRFSAGNVTHWMPLPEPPKGGAE